MGFRGFNRVKWSPVEIDFLKTNRKNMTREQLSVALAKSFGALKIKLDELDGKPPKKKVKKIKQGKRKDLNIYMRSAWEANIARWLTFKDIKWVYEPKSFFFEGVKTGTNTYLPDFYLPDLDVWLEVKGQIIPSGKAALNRFKKFYPEEFKKLRGITGSASTAATKFMTSEKLAIPIMAYYNDIDKECREVVQHWE